MRTATVYLLPLFIVIVVRAVVSRHAVTALAVGKHISSSNMFTFFFVFYFGEAVVSILESFCVSRSRYHKTQVDHFMFVLCSFCAAAATALPSFIYTCVPLAHASVDWQ